MLPIKRREYRFEVEVEESEIDSEIKRGNNALAPHDSLLIPRMKPNKPQRMKCEASHRMKARHAPPSSLWGQWSGFGEVRKTLEDLHPYSIPPPP